MPTTKIPWTNRTINIQGGCSKISPGCDNCFAIPLSNRHNANYLENGGVGLKKYVDTTLNHKEWSGKINADPADIERAFAKLPKKPSMVFVNSMSDLFHHEVPGEFINQVYRAIVNNPIHTFQVLTKRPKLAKMFHKSHCKLTLGDLPIPNLWLGVTVENQDQDHRIIDLLQIQAAVWFVSCEPLLGEIEIQQFEYDHNTLDWIIIGCESGPKRRPCNLDWVYSLVDQCKQANVPVFVKQLDINGKVVSKIEQFPTDLQIREFPG